MSKKILPKMIFTKVNGGYSIFFDDPKKVFGHKSDIIKIHCIFGILESEQKTYGIEDVLFIGKDKTEKFKTLIYDYINTINIEELKFFNKDFNLLSDKNSNINIIKQENDGKIRNIAFETVENLSKLMGFKFGKEYPKTIELNMKSFMLFLKKNQLNDEFINFIKSMESFNKYKSENLDLYSSDSENVFIIKFIADSIYPFFYDGGSNKNITIFLSWFKEFLLNYENMLLGIKILIFYIKNIEKSNIKKFELGILYNTYSKSLNQIINYIGKDYNNIIALINKCAENYKKQNLSFTLKTIAKDMYKYNENNFIIENINYNDEFLLKMKELNIPKDMYSEYYKIYLKDGINGL